VSQAKETSQTADTVVNNNIVKMWSRMFARNRANSVWFINQEIEPQLHTMSLTVGTGGSTTYLPPNGLSDSPYSTLYGRPVIPIEQASALGDLGDIIFADMSQYMLIDKGGLKTDSSMHVRFLYGEQTFRFIFRIDGQSLWNSALTPYKGAATLSPFVSLAARA
jgi:HK97 family phage major capsid protein